MQNQSTPNAQTNARVLRRDAFLRAQGFGVLRFGSNDPFVNLEGVLQAIVNRLDELTAACPHPDLPPEGKEPNPGAIHETNPRRLHRLRHPHAHRQVAPRLLPQLSP
ncbi:MAG: DUF559 domain-containing protein [Variovorax sp.]|nr:MAG: DUF559 domain-containing protein [Variovorax sp.]